MSKASGKMEQSKIRNKVYDSSSDSSSNINKLVNNSHCKNYLLFLPFPFDFALTFAFGVVIINDLMLCLLNKLGCERSYLVCLWKKKQQTGTRRMKFLMWMSLLLILSIGTIFVCLWLDLLHRNIGIFYFISSNS